MLRHACCSSGQTSTTPCATAHGVREASSTVAARVGGPAVIQTDFINGTRKHVVRSTALTQDWSSTPTVNQ